MTGLIQYVIVRGDLLKTMSWPIGAVIAQACHATTACTYLFKDDPQMQEYMADLDNMHKVVLEAPDEKTLQTLHEKLATDEIAHKFWIEQPENIPTCIAVKPYPKEKIQKYFKKLRLMSFKMES